MPAARRFFDPARHRAVLFDQRGAGRSTPHGEVRANTTWHLVADVETIRQRLGIGSWLVFGGSWGTTLGLAYAQAHPGRVTGLVLRGVLLLRRSERDWFYQGGLRHLQPEEWERFVAPIPPDERDDVLAAYHRRLHGPDQARAREYARAWGRWEAVNSSLRPDPELLAHFTADDHARGGPDPVALRGARRFPGRGPVARRRGPDPAPARRDRQRPVRHVLPAGVRVRPARRWPEATLRIVPEAGPPPPSRPSPGRCCAHSTR
ncbi:alpha/beta fold hydrolase [Micromonospora sp. BRA006-A]|nr:alpha/beta fold hydrolase [Micromonospora sp. BRA006-A]